MLYFFAYIVQSCLMGFAILWSICSMSHWLGTFLGPRLRFFRLWLQCCLERMPLSVTMPSMTMRMASLELLRRKWTPPKSRFCLLGRLLRIQPTFGCLSLASLSAPGKIPSILALVSAPWFGAGLLPTQDFVRGADPYLLAAFEKLSKESKFFVHFAFLSMVASSAAAHAISHADEFVRNLFGFVGASMDVILQGSRKGFHQ